MKIFEQAAQLGEVGAGIQLSPNCLRVLFDAGLEQALRKIAFIPEATQMRSWNSGRVLTSSLLGETVQSTYGYPYFHVHRADLIEVLKQAVLASNSIQLHTLAQVKTHSATENSACVQLSDGREFSGDVLVGADGIHSVVRDQLFGNDSPSFTGNVAWRALVPAAKLPPGLVRPMSTVWWGPGAHFVHYYVRKGELVNCVCVVEKQGWQIESWNQRGNIEDLREDFSGWHSDIQQLINNAATDSLYKWALFDRPPMSQWSRGLVTLLGDACHPTLPFMAQGAAMAIEDGAVLAACLSIASEPVSGLMDYQKLRQKRTAGIQLGSRRNAELFHLKGVAAWRRNLLLKLPHKNPMQSLFGYNALTARQSL